ncbi:MAG: hypothetical protein K8I82_09620, partial [Anaerolineae bacterium]|nr:hypothetical protein [Anaerolineae bacterium]
MPIVIYLFLMMDLLFFHVVSMYFSEKRTMLRTIDRSRGDTAMLSWALIFLVIAIIAGILGFGVI